MADALIQTAIHEYSHAGQRLLGWMAHKTEGTAPKPAVLVVHDWSGRNAFACQKAEMLADLGYLGFAVDMYGDARVGETTEEKTALMQTVAADRQFLRSRIQAAFETVLTLPMVDKKRIAVIGFCFGGLCALELARSGTDIIGAVSFHGLLNKAPELKNQPIKSKVLAMHGYNDPMVSPQDVQVFCEEMTTAHVDWQVHLYGQTVHGFTNPKANDHQLGTVYNPVAEKRALQTMTHFLQEIFQ